RHRRPARRTTRAGYLSLAGRGTQPPPHWRQVLSTHLSPAGRGTQPPGHWWRALTGRESKRRPGQRGFGPVARTEKSAATATLACRPTRGAGTEGLSTNTELILS